ncbi:hypothetical protein [Aliarcobacter butzleri]|uniref:hypothetical protein n=1 Tax=Aliarcobacter butzleri TaxID=28197 RepID=UPI00125FC192|nr:hypothetical protein [Aliarcobacter butzleri]
MKNMLKTRKDQIVNNVGGEDELKKLQKVKLLKLMELEIQELLKYWNLSQTLKILNNELGLKISKTVFYDFCAKNLKKDEKSIKRDKGAVQKRTTEKDEKSINNIDDLTESTLVFLSKNLPKK